MFNLLLIVILDFLHRKESVYSSAKIGHTLSAGFGVILIGFVAMNLLLAKTGLELSIAHIGLYTPVTFIIYALAMRTVFYYEHMPESAGADVVDKCYPTITVKQAIVGYGLASVFIVVAGLWLLVALHWLLSWVGMKVLSAHCW